MLMLAGTSLGGTSLFYYIAVQYINVSIAIVLLMQSVWFSSSGKYSDQKLPNARKGGFSYYCIGRNRSGN
jgi:hypothetical protein